MKQMRNAFFISGLILVLSCQQQMESKLGIENENGSPIALKGDYFGQTLPDSLPILFAPAVVSNGVDNRDITFMPDGNEFYFSSSLGKYTTILTADRNQGRWTKPEVATFASNPAYQYIEPFISPDGKQFFFASNQAKTDAAEKGDFNIWVMQRQHDSWGKPELLPEFINTKEGEFYPVVARNGNLYFTRSAPHGKNFIYRSKWHEGVYQEPEKLPEQVNCGSNRFNAFISPDEDFIIIPAMGMKESFGRVDYFVSFRSSEDKWSDPINMGNHINATDNMGWSASLSPDGKLLFFMSKRGLPEESQPVKLTANFLKEMQTKAQNGNADIYWVKAGLIDELKQNAIWKRD